MRKLALMITALFLGGASVCQAAQGTANIVATSTNTAVSGSAHFEDTPGGLKVSVSIAHAEPGNHGFHIHEFGSCEDQGKAAGSHYNPLHSPHGMILKDGPEKAHKGDLGNIMIKNDGTGTLEAVVPNLSLAEGPYTVGGRSIVFHEKVDDLGQPVGNAGAREGCGIIAVTAN